MTAPFFYMGILNDEKITITGKTKSGIVMRDGWLVIWFSHTPHTQ